MKKPYVAIVDDEAGFANYLRTFLSLRGYETRSYSRGDEMVASVKQGDPPDVVLLDVMMPGMNGLETLRALKAAKADLQVIMLSGREQASTIYGDVCAIAHHFHWSELDILALPAARRTRYAELATDHARQRGIAP